MFTIFVLTLAIIILFIGVAVASKGNKDCDKEVLFGGLVTSFVAGVVFLLVLVLSSLYSVDEGEALLLTQFGRIYGTENSAGIHGKRPWANTIEWITRLKSEDQKIEARTKDDMIINVEITFWWSVDSTKVDKIYSSIAKNYEALEEGFVIPGIRSTLRDEIAKTSFRDLNTNREKYSNDITKYIAEQLKKKHIIIDKVNIRNIIPPKAVNASIERKLQAEQQVEEATQKLELAKKDAEIKRIEAQGIADAQSIIQRKLTPIYVQYEGIQMMKSLAKSENTTFIFAPTSMKGIGIPSVYGAPIK